MYSSDEPITVTPSQTVNFPGTVASQLPPASAARSTITEPGFIAATICMQFSQGLHHPWLQQETYLFRDQPGGWLPRNERSCNYDVYIPALFHKELHLGFNELLRHLFRIPALAGSFFLDVYLYEFGTERLNLLTGCRACVEPAYNCSETASLEDRTLVDREKKQASSDIPQQWHSNRPRRLLLQEPYSGESVVSVSQKSTGATELQIEEPCWNSHAVSKGRALDSDLGMTYPAAVTWPVRKRPYLFEASRTALYPAILAMELFNASVNQSQSVPA